MKQTIIAGVIVLAVAAGTYVAAAKETAQDMMQKGMGMMDGNSMMMQKGMGMMHEKSMDAMGMHPMACSSMVAASDGGVIIMMGPKLLKYDKDLNLVKQVEIKIDWEAWHKTMMEHRKMMMQEQSTAK
jgi:prephenate dehydrogenase